MSRQTIFVIVFLVLAVVVGCVIYFGFLGKGPQAQASTFAPLPGLPINLEDIVAKEELKILNDPRFGMLTDPLGLPVGKKEGGRANPFAPVP